MDGDEFAGFRRSGNDWNACRHFDVAKWPKLNVTIVVSQDESTWPPAPSAPPPPADA